MTSVASTELIAFQREACDLTDYPSSVNSGLVGNAAHRRANSYHNSKQDNPRKARGSYTNKWPKDLSPPAKTHLVTGSDRSMSRADMVKSWKRHKAVFDDKTDPRRQYLAEYIGTPDGRTAYRLDFGDGSVDVSSPDHTWHEHEGWWYLYAESPDARKASLSIKRGETKAQYLASIGQAPPPATREINGGKMFAIVQVGTGAAVWLAERSVGPDGKVYAALTGINSESDAKTFVAMGADASRANPLYGDPNAVPFKSEDEMRRVVFLGTEQVK